MSAAALDQSRFGGSVALHGPAYEWALWSTTVRLLTSDPHALPSARRLVDAELARVELAVSRSRRDCEIATLPTGRRVRISSTLTGILSAALSAARESHGAVDPTLGRALEAVKPDGEGRAAGLVRGDLSPASLASGVRWEGVELDEQAQTVMLPQGVQLDLGTVSRAWAADRCAAVVVDRLDVGVLVSLGGDIATAGPPGASGDGSWEIVVQDRSAGPSALIAVPTGLAVATSSTGSAGSAGSAGWEAGGRESRDRLRPDRTASRSWRSATVVAQDCVTASTWSRVALGEERGALALLESQGYPVRLVAADGFVRHLSGWPTDAEDTAVGA